ncbi:MAG: Xaa-Pro peptidase family protein, partial [Clostridiales bacterium]|nr:Xaa-Pro peptidase family protein [Clostridiales bacterium]
MKPLYEERMDDFRKEIHLREREAFLVTKPENVQYLSGFRGDSTWLVITEGEKVLITDSRYTEQARQESPGWPLRETTTGLVDALKAYRDSLPFADLAFDHKDVSMELYQRLDLALGADIRLYGEDDPSSLLRQVKDDWEVARIQEAASLADSALDALRHMVKPGISEKALALELDYLMGKAGSEGAAFAPIVAAGPQGAMPHARPSAYTLRQGDMVTFDFGAVAGGYRSDITRTFVLGEPDRLQRERYLCVLEAQERALAQIRPGASTRQVDSIAREYLTEMG